MRGHRLVSDQDLPIRMRCIPRQLRIWSILSGTALIQQSLTKGSQTCPACIVGLSHMEFSMRSTHEPCLFRVTFQRVVPANAGTHTARNLVLALEQRPFLLLRPGVMGPCVRRDDQLIA